MATEPDRPASRFLDATEVEVPEIEAAGKPVESAQIVTREVYHPRRRKQYLNITTTDGWTYTFIRFSADPEPEPYTFRQKTRPDGSLSDTSAILPSTVLKVVRKMGQREVPA